MRTDTGIILRTFNQEKTHITSHGFEEAREKYVCVKRLGVDDGCRKHWKERLKIRRGTDEHLLVFWKHINIFGLRTGRNTTFGFEI